MIYHYKNYLSTSKKEITLEEENKLREYINDYNKTKNEMNKELIQEEFPDFDISLFNIYPFYNFEKLSYKKSYFDIFKNIVLLQSRINPIFLEEMYHEYVYEKKIII